MTDMKRSLKDSLGKNTARGAADAGNDLPNGVSEEISDLVGKYSGMSESELMRTLKTETDRQKKEGRFDQASLTNGMNAILPMLNDGQKKKLFEIINQIKG